MLPKVWTIHVDDILEAIDKINHYTQDVTFDEFVSNGMMFDAVVWNFSVLGEAVRRIPPEIQNQHPDVAWSEMRSMRNFVIHQYDEVNAQVVWDTIQNDLPPLVTQLQEILANE